MSTSCGACGAYGILLSEIDMPTVVAIREKLDKIVVDFPESDNFDLEEYNTPEDYPGIKELIDPLKQAFRVSGISVPEEASLQWTGSEDDRPARCNTPSEDWVLGFGLFTIPNNIPTLDKSFIKVSEWHDWVWMG
jgi:hypothetical protein